VSRRGLIADVHANLPALEAVLRRLRALDIADLLVAGDLVGYGAQPNEVVELLQDAGAVCVLGNHDLMALGVSNGPCSELCQRCMEYTRRVLSPATRDYLAALPEEQIVDDVVVAHGGLGDPWRYVRNRAEAEVELQALRRRVPQARWLVLGHTHRRAVYGDESSHVVNPGSVGQSRGLLPVATFGVLDGGSCRLFSAAYDLRAARRSLRDADLPWRAVHSPPRLGQAVRRRLKLRRG
jgi:putative phosphoesterase